MKSSNYFLFLNMLIIAFFSCEKEEPQDDNIARSFLDYDNFPKDGLVAYYPFNGNTDDYSVNKLNGEANEISYGTDRFGKLDGTCIFNGENSLIEIKNSDLLNKNSYTICFWYRSNLEDTLTQSVISKSDSLGNGYVFDLVNREYFSYLGFAFKDKTFVESLWVPIDPPIKVWTSDDKKHFYFAAIAFSEYVLIDYQNDRTLTGSLAVYFNKNDYNLIVGASENSKYKNFNGELDDLLIYDRILSQDEIKQLCLFRGE